MKKIGIYLLAFLIVNHSFGCATTQSSGTETLEYESEQSGNNFYSQSILTTESQESAYSEEGIEAGEVIKGVLGSVLIVFYMLLMFAPLSAL